MELLETVALFPGQGSQSIGMGKKFFENFSLARELFEEASDVIRINLKKLCFEGPESELTKTENLQPALVTVSTVAYRIATQEAGFKPHAAAGHSLGEYSALIAAQVFSFSQVISWVHARGRFMQEAVPEGQGGMTALLGLKDEDVHTLCQETENHARSLGVANPVCEPANFNSEGQVVVAGTRQTLEFIQTVAKSSANTALQKAKALPLPVSAPFHCSLMNPAREKMADRFKKDQIMPRSPLFPIVANRTARLTTEPTLFYELLIEQIDHPVLWKQSCELLLQKGAKRFVEFGTGKVLSGLIKRIAPSSLTLLQIQEPEGLKVIKS